MLTLEGATICPSHGQADSAGAVVVHSIVMAEDKIAYALIGLARRVDVGRP